MSNSRPRASAASRATPFTFTNGYTIVFDATRRVGVTVHREAAEAIARDAARYAALPARSTQNPILRFAPHDLVGVVALDAGIALTELRSAEGAGLEDMFLSLTAETQREGVAA